MASIAAPIVAQHAAAKHDVADVASPGTGKVPGGLAALFAALLAASGGNASARAAVKNTASSTDALKPAAAAETVSVAAKDKPAGKTKNGNTATETLAALPAPAVAAPDIAGIKKTAQTQDAGANGVTAKRHAGAPPIPAAALSAAAQAGSKSEDTAVKPAVPDADAANTAVPQGANGKPQTAATVQNDKDLHAALAALQTHADKAIHRNIPAEKTGQALTLPAVAAAARDGEQRGNSASSNSGGRDTHSQDRHDGGATAPAKSASAPAETAAAPPPATGNAGAPTSNPNAVSQTATAHVSAALEISPQSAAHPLLHSGADNRAVPLSNLGALVVSIAAKSRGGAKQFDIDLHPAELGNIHVRLSVEHSGLAQAHLTADNSQTLALLQRDSQALERALKDAGLNLAGNGLNFSLKGQEREAGGGPRPNGRSRDLSVSAIASPAPAGTLSIGSLAPDGVRLDIRV